MSDSATPCTAARQAPLSRGFSRQEYWSGLPCPPPGHLPDPGVEPASLMSLHWQVGSLPLAPPGKPIHSAAITQKKLKHVFSKMLKETVCNCLVGKKRNWDRRLLGIDVLLTNKNFFFFFSFTIHRSAALGIIYDTLDKLTACFFWRLCFDSPLNWLIDFWAPLQATTSQENTKAGSIR